jgi:hypothetical protein
MSWAAGFMQERHSAQVASATSTEGKKPDSVTPALKLVGAGIES